MNFKRVGVLGTGPAGRTLCEAFATLGLEVMMGSRDADNERAADWGATGGGRASAGTFAEAARYGEIVVLATLGKQTENAIGLAGEASFGKKLLIDVTNPLDYQPSAPPELFVGTTDSLGERVQRWLPNAHVVKAFNSVGAMNFFRPEFPGGPPDMFIAGNDYPAKGTVSEICAAFGWGVADVGGIQSSRWLEALCLLWVTYATSTPSLNHAFRVLKR